MIGVAIVVGHSERSQGASNVNGLTEFEFNQRLACCIKSRGIRGADVIDVVFRDTYRALPDDINALNPDAIVSLHCNAFNTRVSGTETLYYHSSRSGRRLAELLQVEVATTLELPNRGVKPVDSEGRGGYLLKYTNAPCVIAEPFFIDNPDDLKTAIERFYALASAYCRAIEGCLR